MYTKWKNERKKKASHKSLARWNLIFQQWISIQLMMLQATKGKVLLWQKYMCWLITQSQSNQYGISVFILSLADHKFHAELENFSVWSQNQYIHVKKKLIFKWKLILAKVCRHLYSGVLATNDSCIIIYYICIRNSVLYFLFILDVLVLPSSGLFIAVFQLHWVEDEAQTRLIQAHHSTAVFSNPKVSRVR